MIPYRWWLVHCDFGPPECDRLKKTYLVTSDDPWCAFVTAEEKFRLEHSLHPGAVIFVTINQLLPGGEQGPDLIDFVGAREANEAAREEMRRAEGCHEAEVR